MTSNCYEVSKVLSISVTNYILIPKETVTNSELSFDIRNTAYVEHKNKWYSRGSWNHLKSFRKYLDSMSGRHDMKELQKMAILGTSMHTSERTHLKVQSI